MADDANKKPGQKLAAAIGSLCQSADADMVLLVGGMYGEAPDKLCRMIEEQRTRDKVVLVIGTLGGSPEVAYRFSRILQHEFDKFVVVVDNLCKSAGTLLAIGATEVVMSNRGELGPLDIQVGKLDEPKERTSGLAPVQALKILQEQVGATYISLFKEWSHKLPIPTRTAVATAEAVTSALFSKLYAQLEPVRLGEYQRAMSLMTEYGKRLNDVSKNLQDGRLDALVTDYPDHSFAIDRYEAADLFVNIRSPNQAERELLSLLDGLFAVHLDDKEPMLFYHPAGAKPKPGEGSKNGTHQQSTRAGSPASKAKAGAGNAGASGGEGQSQDGSQPPASPTAPRLPHPGGKPSGGRRRNR